MVCLPDASWGFLTPPEAFGHFLMLHYTSYCLMLLVGSSWIVFIAFFTRLPQHKNLEIMKSVWILKWAQPDPPKKLMQWKKNLPGTFWHLSGTVYHLPGTFWHLPGTTRHVLNCVGILQLPGKPEIVLTVWKGLDSLKWSWQSRDPTWTVSCEGRGYRGVGYRMLGGPAEKSVLENI